MEQRGGDGHLGACLGHGDRQPADQRFRAPVTYELWSNDILLIFVFSEIRTTMKKKILSAAILLMMPLVCLSRNIDITRMGAKPDLKKDNAPSIQKAIDKVSQEGGGTVTVPSGDFLTGPLELKSGVELHLDQGARLVGVADLKAYDKAHLTKDGKTSPFCALIYSYDKENVAITGLGTIDGQGGDKAFKVQGDPGGRPMILLFRNCRNVSVSGVSLENSAHWVEYYTDCVGVRINGIKVRSHCNYNNDGIDIESRDVVVSNCIFDCEDDAICLKGAGENLCENITVTNCIAASNCNAIKLGTASSTGYRNVTISNISIRHANQDNFRHWSTKVEGISAPTTVISGIAVEVVDGGIAENINISNISMRDVQTPIFIRMGRRSVSASAETCWMKGIVINGVTAVSESLMSSSITGVRGLRPQDIYLSNIDITGPGGGTLEMAGAEVPEAESSYPENRHLGTCLPASGIYIRHADNVFLSNVRFHFREKDERPLMVCDDCRNIIRE